LAIDLQVHISQLVLHIFILFLWYQHLVGNQEAHSKRSLVLTISYLAKGRCTLIVIVVVALLKAKWEASSEEHVNK
jgi:hypothetical protein